MKKTIIGGIASTMTAFLLTSCATIFTGTKAKINLIGEIQEPITIATHDSTYQTASLPFTFKVKRKKLDWPIKITSDNYTYPDIIPGKSVNGWTFGNIAIGGLIGLGVDFATGAVNKPAKSAYVVEPTHK